MKTNERNDNRTSKRQTKRSMKYSIARIYYKHESKRKLQQLLLLFDPFYLQLKQFRMPKIVNEKVY